MSSVESKKPTQPFEILLVEDTQADVDLVRESLSERGRPNRLHVAEDGEEAMLFLRRSGPFADAPTPNLILLDLNLPRRDGRDLLEEIKSDPDLKVIPVVVLTTSQYEEDIVHAYRLNANCYITKPMELADFFDAIQRIEEFWFSIATLPVLR